MQKVTAEVVFQVDTLDPEELKASLAELQDVASFTQNETTPRRVTATIDFEPPADPALTGLTEYQLACKGCAVALVMAKVPKFVLSGVSILISETGVETEEGAENAQSETRSETDEGGAKPDSATS